MRTGRRSCSVSVDTGRCRPRDPFDERAVLTPTIRGSPELIGSEGGVNYSLSVCLGDVTVAGHRRTARDGDGYSAAGAIDT